jgi:16S rRNA G527 N7-methylase RsmG
VNSPDRQAFVEWLTARHPQLSEECRGRLLAYGDAVASSHPRLGLVSKGDLSRIFMRHLRECLTPALLEALPAGARVVDVGSGAGLPGIPFSLLREDLELWLVEPRERRAAFLERMTLALRLPRAHVLPGSLERVARGRSDLQWDLAVSRALRWTPAMLDALAGRATLRASILRFGTPELSRAGVTVIPLDSDSPRAAQIWPRESWEALPEAR